MTIGQNMQLNIDHLIAYFGGVKRAHAFKRHILTKKTTKNKRQLRGTSMVNDRDLASVAKMLPYA